MKTIDVIKREPITLNQWMIEQVGFDNNGPYKEAYPKMPVHESGEIMVSASDYGLVSSDFYLNEYVDGKNYLSEALNKGILKYSAYLRISHVERLQRVDSFLRKEGLFLYIRSGWRHPDLQEVIKNEYAKEYGARKASQMFAPVIENAAPPPHATGAAFDLELRDLRFGERQELYYSYEGRQIYGTHELESLAFSHPEFMKNVDFKKAIENRRILFHSLCTLGVVFQNQDELFTPHPGECWHFGDGDPLSAYLRKEPVARYGLATF